MDHHRFETLLRSLSATPSRRDTLRLVVASALGGILAIDERATEARKRGRGKSKGRHKKQSGGASGSRTPQSGPTCADGIKNGSESDVDCGGSCSRCATGRTCASRNDCASARCEGATCQPCVNALTDCGTDADGSMCACRDHESGQRFCTKINGRLLSVGTPCSACQGAEQCFPINGGANGIECILPCGAPAV